MHPPKSILPSGQPIAYDLVVFRFRPDMFAEEFANCGILVALKNETGQIRDFEFLIETRHTARFSDFFKDLWSRQSYSNFARARRDHAQTIKKRFSETPDMTIQTVEELMCEIHSGRGGSFFWGTPISGLAFDLKAEIKEFYWQYVSRHFEKKIAMPSDRDIWNKHRISVERTLTEAKTINRFNFDTTVPDMSGLTMALGWRNGQAQYLEALSFSLKEPDSIRDKTERWMGRIEKMRRRVGDFKCSFVISDPLSNKTSSTVDRQRLELEKTENVRAVITEAELSRFIGEISREAK